MSLEYPKPYIHDLTLAILLGGSEDRRYSWVKRALKKGTLVRLKRGVYLIEKKDALPVDSFEIAQHLNGPSYISFESALAHHGWIPEAVYTVTSATSKRSSIVVTPIGTFSFEHIPPFQFFMGVEHVATPNGAFLIADPWKALMDYMYVHHKKWNNLKDAIDDLRLDESALLNANTAVLKEIAEYYDSPRIQRFARLILRGLKQWD